MKAYKSRSLRRVYVKTPGGKVVIHHRQRKSKKLRCSICKKPLPGTIRVSAYGLRRIAKTKKRPSRPYGGIFCSRCMREKLKTEIHKKLKFEK